MPRLARFGIPVLLIALISLGLRLASFQFGLPYVEWHDEAHLYWHGQCVRGLYDPTYCAGYPPGYQMLSVLSQVINESLGRPGLAASVETLRLLGALWSIAGISAAALSARLIAGCTAGIVAAAVWGLTPLSIEYALYAIPESITIPGSLIAFLCALMALMNRSRWRLALVSLGVGVVITLFDYRMAVYCLPAMLVLALHVLEQRWTGWRVWIALLALAATGLALLGALFMVLLPNMSYILINALTVRLWNASGLLHTLVQAHEFTTPILALAVYTASALALSAPRNRPTRQQIAALVLCIVVAFAVCLVGFTADWDVNQPHARIQNILPASALCAVLIGCAVAFILTRTAPRRALTALIGAGLALALVAPRLAESAAFTTAHRLESAHVALRRWAEDSLDPGTIIVDDANHKTFNPFWGGIPHRVWFDWWVTDDFIGRTADQWREQGMVYLALPIHIQSRLLQDPDGARWLEPMLPLREFRADMGLRGPEVAVYRLWQMEHRLNAAFGDHIRLIGYDGSFEGLQPNDAQRLRLYWQASQPPTVNYSLFVHLTPADSLRPIVQWDGEPARATRPTSTWTLPDEILIGEAFDLVLPIDLQPGTYRLLLGLYNFVTGVRLPVTVDGAPSGDALQIASISIAP